MSEKLYDIHVHIPDPAAFPLFAENRIILRMLLKKMEIRGITATPADVEAYNREVLRLIDASIPDYVVLLAIDAAHGENGMASGTVIVSNDYIAGLCRKSRKTLFGASIHPYRKNALGLLENCVKNGACLVKWIPSAQNINPEDRRCLPFYEMLAAYKLPLLCHTGCEHTLSGGRNEYDNPVRLVPAIRRGVTVIAAHCGARMFLHEKSYFDKWCRLALEYENFYGDISAFVIPTRLHLIRKLLRDERLLPKVLYGSDFPGFPLLWSCLFDIGIRKISELSREENPFDRHLRVLRELGLPDEIFARAGRLLGIPL